MGAKKGYLQIGKVVVLAARDIPGVVSGWESLANECLRSQFGKLIVDVSDSPAANLAQFDLVCLSAGAAFKADAAMVKSLRGYLGTGKSILVEALTPGAEKAWGDLFAKLEVSPQPLSADDSILTTPYLFPAASAALVWKAGPIIYSPEGFNRACSGKGAASRADIRSAHEWGMDLIAACLENPG